MKLKLEVPGVKACGPYKAGVVYDVADRNEIDRLINVKGFTVVEPEAARTLSRSPAPLRDKKLTKSGSEDKA